MFGGSLVPFTLRQSNMVMEYVPFFLVGNTSSNGPVIIAMLVYWSVLQVLLELPMNGTIFWIGFEG